MMLAYLTYMPSSFKQWNITMSKNQGLIYKHRSLQKTFQVHKKNDDNWNKEKQSVNEYWCSTWYCTWLGLYQLKHAACVYIPYRGLYKGQQRSLMSHHWCGWNLLQNAETLEEDKFKNKCAEHQKVFLKWVRSV